MRIFSTLVSCTFIMFVPLTVQSQTPDGQTPAEEAICDPLQEDGVTKGLYGLCVAFCEAQDIASIDETITNEQLLALKLESPSGKILESFDRKKQETDPEMPCIKVQEPCPCWSSEELSTVANNKPGTIRRGCDRLVDPETGLVDVVNVYENSPNRVHAIAYDVNRSGGDIVVQQCYYWDANATPHVQRIFSTDRGTLTLEQLEACYQQVENRCLELGF